MKEAVVAIIYPEVETFDAHVAEIEAMLPETRAFPGCLQAYVGVNRDRHEVLIFHLWQSNADLEHYLVWRADRGDLDARSATMRREQEFRSFAVP